MMGDGIFGMGFGGPILWIIVIVVIVALVPWLGRMGGGRDGGEARRGRRALEILEERYARGEIEREEYERKRRDLEEGP